MGDVGDRFDADLRVHLADAGAFVAEAWRLREAGELTVEHRALLGSVLSGLEDLGRLLDPANAELVVSVQRLIDEGVPE